jgi:replicative DNA helicase
MADFIDSSSAQRQVPQNIDAEINLLGALIQDAEGFTEILAILDEESFYLEKHQIIWKALTHLYRQGTLIDLVTLATTLESQGKLQFIGGKEYLFNLIESVASSANVLWHAQIIHSKYILRKLISNSNETIRAAQDPAASPDDILQESERQIFSLAEKQVRDSMRPIETHISSLLTKLKDRRDGITGCPTGFTELDSLTNGLQPSDLIILAGRPGMGKTAFALSLASNAAINFGRQVAFFSLEMDGEQLVQRILASRAQVNMSNIRSGHLSKDDKQRVYAQVQPIIESKFFVDDNSDLGIMELMSKTRSLKRKSGLDLVIVDYLQLMKTGKEENRAVAIGAISRGLKILAKDLRVPIIALAQLSRKAEEKGRERPQLSDLRESGSIEQDADMVWFVERPAYRTHAEEDKYKAQLLVAKHRNGSVADIDLVFKPEFTTFYNASPEDLMDQGNDFGDFE